MNTGKIYKHFINSSERDYETFLHFYKSKHYMWALFVGHLCLEKLVKACYVKKHNKIPPFIHDLLRLAELAELNLDDIQKNQLDEITKFNINARYEDYKNRFYKLCTKKYASIWIKVIEKLWKHIKERY